MEGKTGKGIASYSRFYGLLTAMPGVDREDLKRSLVQQWTKGRTESLREMTGPEYEAMCSYLTGLYQDREDLRWRRSICLKLMQQYGVDTTDWNAVNRFCEDPRIAGKRFARITSEELLGLSKKLRSIVRKKYTEQGKRQQTFFMLILPQMLSSH